MRKILLMGSLVIAHAVSTVTPQMMPVGPPPARPAVVTPSFPTPLAPPPERRPDAPAPPQPTTGKTTDNAPEAINSDSSTITTTAPASSKTLVIDPFPQCVPSPTVADLAGNYKLEQRLLTTSQAARANIPYVSGSGDGAQMVLVRDYLRGKECRASDGKTVLLYGQTIRTIITLADYNSSLGLSLPVIAADATINKRNHQVLITSYGFENPKINDVLANVSVQEFNVDHYGEYMTVQKQLIQLINDPGTKQSVERLGIVAANVDDYRDSVATVFALQEIADGSSCVDAKNDYPRDPTWAAMGSAVEHAYVTVVGACSTDRPDNIQRSAAKRLLAGTRLKW